MMQVLHTTVSIGQSFRKTKRVVDGELNEDWFAHPPIYYGDLDTKDGRHFTAAVHRQNKRGTETFRYAGLLALDVDKCEREELTHALQRLRLAGHEFLLYSTISHTPEAPRVRIILPLDKRVDMDQYRWIGKAVANEFGLKIDRAGLNPCQPMLLPLVTPEGQGDYRHYMNTGRALEVAKYTDDMPDPSHNAEGSTAAQDDTRMTAMAIPAGITETAFYAAVGLAYPAKGLEYDDYWNMYMAMHHQSGGTDKGFDFCWNWSSQEDNDKHGLKINERAMRYKYRTQRKTGRLFKLRTLLKKDCPGGGSYLGKTFSILLEQFTDSVEAVERVAGAIREERELKAKDIVQLVRSYRDAMRKHGEELELWQAKEQLLEGRDVLEDPDYYHDRWVYNTAVSEYQRISDGYSLNKGDFDLSYTRYMPVNDRGVKQDATIVFKRGLHGINPPRMVRGERFHPEPDAEVLIETPDGLYRNSFNRNAWPESGPDFNPNDPIDHEIQQRFYRLVYALTSGDTERARLLLQFLAHLRQRPWVRIKWGVCLTSPFTGAGKSTIFELLQSVLGEDHVGKVAQSSLLEKFNAYTAEPRIVKIIEEARYDKWSQKEEAMNNLKDAITADAGAVRRMKNDAVMEPYTGSYILFSNYRDVLGNEEGERRWFANHSKARNEAGLGDYLGEHPHAFGLRFHELRRTYPSRFCAFLESVSLDGFSALRFPETMRNERLGDMYHNMITTVLHEMIESYAIAELGEEYAYLPAIHTYICGQASMSDDDDVYQTLSADPRALRRTIHAGLAELGYAPLSDAPSAKEQDVRHPKVAVGLRNNDDGRVRANLAYVRVTSGREWPTHREARAKVFRRLYLAEVERRVNNEPTPKRSGPKVVPISEGLSSPARTASTAANDPPAPQ